MIHHSFAAMGTRIEAWCDRGKAKEEAVLWFEAVEAVCSRFRPDSELSLVNRSSDVRVALSPTLLQVMTAAAQARELTDGLVDAGVGGLVGAWGYDRTHSEVEDIAETPTDLIAPEWMLDGGELVRKPGTSIDLGGICKGWTSDRAVEMGLASVVSAGGDIRSAHRETTVPVLDPWEKTVARVRVGEGALATSSTTRRRWRVGGSEASHLIDPRTLAPVRTPVLSASVVARSAVEAEAGAKAVLLHGEEGLAWADQVDWIDAALVIWHDGSVYATSSLDVGA